MCAALFLGLSHIMTGARRGKGGSHAGCYDLMLSHLRAAILLIG